MTNEPASVRLETARDLRQELTEAVVRRFGVPRAAAMESEIAAAAETLAGVATVALAPTAHEPDFIGPIDEVTP